MSANYPLAFSFYKKFRRLNVIYLEKNNLSDGFLEKVSYLISGGE